MNDLISTLLAAGMCVSVSAPGFSQTLTSRTYGGSNSDVANAVTTDSAGNIYVAGTTYSFDLPLLHPFQSQNSGTQLMFSPDAGATWKPLGNLPNGYTQSGPYPSLPLAADPTNSAVFYVGFNGMVFKTTDGGLNFSASSLPSSPQVASLAIDPSTPSNVYAATYQGLFKSTDGGATWNGLSGGFPATAVNTSLTIDPFHTESIWVTVNNQAFRSTDGGSTWSQVSLPSPAGEEGSLLIVFDLVKPGVVYVYGTEAQQGALLLKSTDDGKTWSQLNIPFQDKYVGDGPFVADPLRVGYLYVLGYDGVAGIFYRSQDGGASWESFAFPAQLASSIAIDPANPNIIVAGAYRSMDNGATWSPTPVSRYIQPAFAPTGKGLLYATGPITSDIFVAKFAPDGKTLLFATYYGGMGDETAAGIQVDKLGNIWVAGTTTSFDLKVSKNAIQKQLQGVQNTFVAEFSPEGSLHAATYLGGSSVDTLTSLKLNASGEPWIYGQTSSPDFPLTKGSRPTLQLGETYTFLSEIYPSASELIYSAPIDGAMSPGGMTIDAEDNILLTGTTSSSGFVLTPGVVHGNAPPGAGAYLIKLDGSGNTIFSTYFRGSKAATVNMQLLGAYTEFNNAGVAVTTDSTGIYLTGNTSATDFPTTPGAFQTQLKTGCAYPSVADDTGIIGIFYTYQVDDVFMMKLSPDGKQLLYSTLLGGSCYDRPTDIAVTRAGDIFITGETNSFDLPVVHPSYAAPANQVYESFVSMIAANGTTLPFSTYLPAGSAPRLVVLPDGNLEIAGSEGNGAQTMTNVGAYSEFTPTTQAYLGTLNVSGTPPKLDLTGVLNDFSLLPGPIAPGEILEMTIPDFQPAKSIDMGLNTRLPLGTNLGGTQVLIDGKPADIISIAPGKIVCVAPQSFKSSQGASIQVNFKGALSNSMADGVATTALGLLSADGSGTGLANARNSDGTVNSPRNPAKRGTEVTVYFTGAGVPPPRIYIEAPLNNAPPFTIAPAPGFVTGVYALSFETPTDPNISSPMSVILYGPDSTSQTLQVYIK